MQPLLKESLANLRWYYISCNKSTPSCGSFWPHEGCFFSFLCRPSVIFLTSISVLQSYQCVFPGTLPPGFQSLSCMFCSCVLNTFGIPAIIFHSIGSPNKCSTPFIKCLCHNSYWKRRIWNNWREMLLLMVIWWMDGYGCCELHSFLKLGHTGQWFPCSYRVFC